MLHSTITGKGQTTIPGAIRRSLGIKPGDRLEYTLKGDRILLRVHPGVASLGGRLAGGKGRNLSFAQVRKAAEKASRVRYPDRYEPK